jgi:hypothetical protein
VRKTTAAVLRIAAVVAIAVTTSCDRAAPDAVPRVSPSPAHVPTPVRGTPVAIPTPLEPAVRGGVPAVGGSAILASAPRAQAVVVGTVGDVTNVDLHGWRAAIGVDRVLLGTVRLGDTITIAWEELSTARQVRFANGQRVLVVLDALPTQSLWRKRFPPEQRTQPVFAVASNGDAFLVEPDGATLNGIEHYLAMAATARDGTQGGARLAEIVQEGTPAVAREALTILEAKPDDAPGLDEDGAPALLGAARNPDRETTLRSGALRLAARRRLPGTVETARALAEPGSPIRADAYRAMAMVSGGFSAAEVERVLGDSDPDVRAAAVDLSSDDTPIERLQAVVRTDQAPTVRLAAGRRLLARRNAESIPEVVALLDDPDANVRTGIAEAIGGVGAAAVAPLRAVIDGGSDRAALAAVLGLARAGREGAAMLKAVADHHARAPVQAFARLAMGNAPSSHKH